LHQRIDRSAKAVQLRIGELSMNALGEVTGDGRVDDFAEGCLQVCHHGAALLLIGNDTGRQGQDRIEQRCRNMALAARQFSLLPPTAPESVYDEIWAGLTLDELRVPALSGVAKHQAHGEIELF